MRKKILSSDVYKTKKPVLSTGGATCSYPISWIFQSALLEILRGNYMKFFLLQLSLGNVHNQVLSTILKARDSKYNLRRHEDLFPFFKKKAS
jgi:hypothetical protein